MSRPVTILALHGPANPDLAGWMRGLRETAGAPCRTEAIPLGNFAALNAAIAAHPQDDIVVVVDYIQLETQNWLALFQKSAAALPKAGVLSAKIYDRLRLIYSCGRLVVHRFGMFEHIANIGYGESDMDRYCRPLECDTVIPWFFFIKREALNALNGPPFEESWSEIQGAGRPPWLENDDFCLSVRAAGFSVWTEPAVTARNPKTDTSIMIQELLKMQNMGEMAAPIVNLWKKKWRWNPAYPDPHAIRQKWGETPICWRIGSRLLDDWKTTEPPVDLLMVTRNNLTLLKATMECLAKTTYPHAKLWVLLNGSTDGSKAYLEGIAASFRYPIELIETPVNMGYPVALNWLVAASNAPLLARIDDDIEMEPDWLSRLVARMAANPYAGAIGTKVVDIAKPDSLQWAEYRLWPEASNHQTERDQGQYDYLSRTIANMGCSILYRRRAFLEAGPSDISMSPISWDDLDHQISVWAAGYDVLYDGCVTVKHPWKPLRDYCRRARGNQLGNGTKVRFKWGTGAFQAIDRGLDLAGRRAD